MKLLKGSWANSFYHEFFPKRAGDAICRIDEEIFAVLYSSEPSRPNIPVNVMVGLEVLKAGFGWSDEELYENYCFNLQVCYALGYERLGDGDFAIRTLYYFRERLSKHYLERWENLLEQAFEQVTDAQIRDLQVRMQRTPALACGASVESTQIASDIVDDSQLLAEALPNLQERTDLDTLITSGGFGGEASDTALDGQDVKLIQTAICGSKPDSHQFHLADFDIHFDPQGTPTGITCPYVQKVPITPGRTKGLQARFDPQICSACPFHQEGHCRAQPQKRDPRYLFAFTPKQVRAAQRRKHFLEHLDHGQTCERPSKPQYARSSIPSGPENYPFGEIFG